MKPSWQFRGHVGLLGKLRLYEFRLSDSCYRGVDIIMTVVAVADDRAPQFQPRRNTNRLLLNARHFAVRPAGIAGCA
jgi:hypothetical protein